MGVKINLLKKVKLKNPILIAGFPGMGLVGTISASYIVEKLNMEFIGFVSSERFPPLAAVHSGKPMYPARLYASKKYNMLILVSEFVVPIRAVYALSDVIYDFARKQKVSQIISLGAIVKKSESNKIFAIASTAYLQKTLENEPKMQLVKEGVTTGVTGVLLAKGAIDDFPVISFLSQASAEYMDPIASVSILDAIKVYLSLDDLDTSDLKRDARNVESKMKDLMQKTKQTQSPYKRTSQDSPNDEFGAMYG